MKKMGIALLAVFFLAAWTVSADARPLRDRVGDAVEAAGGTGDEEYGAAGQAEDDKDLEAEDLARICFVQKDAGGRDLVWIRIPPGMYRFAKARAQMKRGHGVVRLVLRPRHHLAIEKATGKLPGRVVLRVSARRFRVASGIKGHYVVRDLAQFMRTDPSDTDAEADKD